MKTRDFDIRCGTFVVLGLCIAFGLSFLACDNDPLSSDSNIDNTNYSASEDFSYRIALGNNNSLRLEAINGTVELEGVPGLDSLKVWGERRVESESTEDAEAHLSELTVEIEEDMNETIVRTNQPEQTSGRNYLVEYNIQVPEDWQLDINQVNGNINISAMNSSVSAGLTNGNLRLWEVSGNLNGELANGNIESKVYIPYLGTCRLSVVNGLLNLMIPGSTSAEFAATVMNGKIDLSNLSLQNQIITSTSVIGTLGAGGGTINLSAVNGNIYVTGF